MSYYSARLLIICLVNDGKSKQNYTCDYPFILFQAKNEDEAFTKALALGKEQETKYTNSDGNDVRWTLAKVEEIWSLGNDIDGIEVGSIMDVWQSNKPISFSHDFKPDNEEPIFSGNP